MSKQGLLSYVFIMSSLLIIATGYNACSDGNNFTAPAGFDEVKLPSEDDAIKAPLAVPNPTIVINDGAEYTRDLGVNLTLGTGAAKMKEMFISNDVNCATGNWEPFQANKAWSLAKGNADTAVYVMYRNEAADETTDCVNDSIVHDDIAPEVSFITQLTNGWVNTANMDAEFTATDNLSGISLIWCAKNQSNNFAACSTTVSYTNMVENVRYELLAQAIDRAGNKSPKVPLNWSVDLTPPTVSFVLTPAAMTADLTPDFSYIGFDSGSGVAGYECQLDAAAAYTACPATQTLSGLADGPHSLVVRAIDNVGFISTPITYNWVQDSAAPTVEFIKTPQSITNDPVAVFEFRGLDGGVAINSFECKLDGGAYLACTSPYTINNLADGTHSFSVIGIDMTGNRSAAITYNWLLDTGKPTISFVTTPESVTNDINASFQVTAADNAGGSGLDFVECMIDGGGYQKCNNNFNFQNLAEGSHTVSARSVDRAGNISDVISYTWMIDLTAPTVLITATPKNPTNSKDAIFQFMGNDGGSGIAEYQCRVDGGNYVNCASPVTYNDLTEGSHTFYVRATDNAGNMSVPATYTWSIDLTGPIISFVKQPNANVFVGDNAEILFRIEDNSGIESYSCTLNGQPQLCTVDVNLILPMSAVQDFTFIVTATDKVGNANTQTITWSSSYNVIAKNKLVKVNGDRPVDILFVVDNSGSMDYERSSLAQRINGFISKINGLDWQIAVISTDARTGTVAREGHLIEFMGMPGVFILDASMDMIAAQTALGTTIQNFPKGSGDEQGVYATKLAIDKFINGSQKHLDFFREGADFATIVLSDEDENSKGTSVQISPTNFLQFINSTWMGKKNFTWHSIIARPGDQACYDFPAQPGFASSAGNLHYSGDIYDELSRLTGYGQAGGAIIGSVCELDYTTQLQDIGQSVRDMQKNVTLDCEPVDGNGDGMVDINVEYQAAGASRFVSYSATYTVQALQLVFNDFLPPGDFKISYTCVLR